MTLLALAGLVTACSDIPTQPESATLAVQMRSFTQSGNDNGRVRLFWPAEDGMCTMWDTEGSLVVMNCANNYPPLASGVFGFTIYADGKILNPTGRAVVYGPTNYPPSFAEIYATYFGVSPKDGLMPLCDWNLRVYPNAYFDWDLSTLLCTTNWSYTISASGKARMHALFDPAHTYDPYP
jgi:hypothetical protein